MRRSLNSKFLIICFSGLVVFSILILLIDLFTISHISSRTSDTNAAALAYIMQPLSEMTDNYFLYNIDAPMETEMASSPFISYSFTTSRYPAGESLKDRMSRDLEELVSSSEAITGAFAYSAATDSFLYSPSLKGSDSPFPDPDANIRDILYSYNTGTLVKLPFYSGKRTTFKLQYHDSVLFVKDLTPKSGIASASLFVVVDLNRMVNYLFRTDSFRPYARSGIQMGMYDSNNTPFYISDSMDEEAANEVLWQRKTENVVKLGKNYGISFSSGALACQYVFIVGRDFLSPFTQGFSIRDLILTNVLVTAAVITLALNLLRRLWQPMDTQIAVISKQLDIDRDMLLTESYGEALSLVSRGISRVREENDTLKQVVPETAGEAIQILLFRMLSGGAVDPKTLESALVYSGSGFGIDDLYVAGLAAIQNCNPSDTNRRYTVNTALNEVLLQHGGNGDYHALAITMDSPYHAIVLSFPKGTSIAKGKQTVNSLLAPLNSALTQLGESGFLAFGHLYHSIYDLSFSFHEAMREWENSKEKTSDSNGKTPIPGVGETEALMAQANRETFLDDETAIVALIDRRAVQISQLIAGNKAASAPQMIDRTIKSVFSDTEIIKWPDRAKRLVNGLTEAMISYPFLSAADLTDASGQLSEFLEDNPSPEELVQAAREAVEVLCSDFTRVLERHNNPYITSSLAYIEEHFKDSNLSLEEIAEQMKIAPNYLSSLFSKSLGKKLFEYINEKRLKYSLELLTSTQAPINEVSEQSGFGSPRNYIRIFKKYMNTTPTAWRKQQAEKTEE